MRILPTGTIIRSPRGRLGRLWQAFWGQWGILRMYWCAAWCGVGPDMPTPAKPLSKKQRRKMAKQYDRVSQT